MKPLFFVPIRTSLFSLISLLVTLSSMYIYLYTPAYAPVANAAPNSTINFQARILTSTGALIPDGNYHVEFKLYDSASSGSSAQGVCSLDSSTDDCWWVETRTTGNLVTVKNGYVTANLGSVTAFGANVPWGQELWLSMNIGGAGGGASWDGEMSPRMKVTAVPYAFAAKEAQQLKVTDSGFTSTISVTTPTANRTITFADQSGTVVLDSTLTTEGDIYYRNGSGLTRLARGANGECLTSNTTTILWGSCGSGGTTLQGAYDAGTAGDQVIALDDTQDSLIFRNPSSNGSNGTGYVLTLDQLATGAMGGLDIQSAGTGNLLRIRDTTATATDVLTVADGGAVTLRNQTNSTTALRVQNAAGTTGLNYDTTNQLLTLRNKTDAATIGSDVFGADNNTCTGTNWTDTGVNTWTHTSGSISNLSCGSPSISTNTTYLIEYSTTGTAMAETYRFNIGGATSDYIRGNNTNSFMVLSTTSTASFTISPTASQTGSITIHSIKAITSSSSAVLSVNDSTGVEKLQIRSTGTANQGFGMYSLQYNTTGLNNIAFGYSALSSNTSGEDNTAIGVNALQYSSDASSNIAVGSGALQNNQGDGNVGIGVNSLNNNSNGYGNTAVGLAALPWNTSGYYNTAIGYNPLNRNRTGNYNVAIGYDPLRANTSGQYNIGIGSRPLYANTTGLYNITISGENGMRSNVNGSNNIALGNSALYENISGNYNVAIGNGALSQNTTGSYNSALGIGAGSAPIPLGQFISLNNLSKSTAIGAYSQTFASNVVSLGGIGAADSAKIGINTGLPTNQLSAESYRYSTGTVTTNATTTITGSSTTFSADMVGSVIYIATNSASTAPYVRTITGYTSATVITVDSAVPVLTNAQYYINYAGLQVTATGTIGIGTLSPGANQLVVDNTSSTNAIFVARDNGTSVFTIADGGDVTISNNLIVNGNTTLGNTGADTLTFGGTIQGADALVFEGATADGNELTLTVTDPTAPRTVTFADQSGTVVLDSTLTTEGDIYYRNGSGLARLARGANGECLTSNTTTILWGSCGGGAGTTLQGAYDAGSAGDQVIALDATQDSLVVRNPSSSGSDSTFVLKVEQLNTGAGVDALVVSNSGTGSILTLQDNGTTVLGVTDGGYLVGNGAATGTTGTTEATARTNVTAITLTTDAFSVNDVIFFNNAGQDYYTRITVDNADGTYTVSPAVSYDASITVTKYTIQNIGATGTDYTTQSNRFFQGYFLGGVVTGAGSTTLSDGNLTSTNDIRIQAADSVVIHNTSNGTQALIVKSTEGNEILTVNATDKKVTLGGATTITTFNVIDEDYISTAPTGGLVGDAVHNVGNYVDLTDGTSNSSGAVDYTNQLSTDFDTTFEYNVSGSADAVYFYAYNNSVQLNEDLAYGGYTAVFDEYSDQIRLHYDGTVLATASLGSINSGTWRTARVVKSGLNIKIYDNSTLYIDYNDVSRDLSGDHFGLGARSGALSATHRVRNFYLESTTPISNPAVSVDTINGWTTFTSFTNNATAFKVQNSAATNIFNVNTTDSQVEVTKLKVGAASATTGSIMLNNSTNANTVTLTSGTTSTSYELILPSAIGASGQCLTLGLQGQMNFRDCQGTVQDEGVTITQTDILNFEGNNIAVSSGSASTTDFDTEVNSYSPTVYLKLDDPSGTTAQDATANNNDGTYVGTPTLAVAGIANDSDAVQLDGTDDEVTLPWLAAYNPTTSGLTISAWYKGSDVGTTSNYQTWPAIVSADTNSSNKRWALLIDNTGMPALVTDNDYVITQGTHAINDGNWHFIVATITASPGFDHAVYVDGQLSGSSTAANDGGSGSPTLSIGRETRWGNYLSGTVDNVAIYPSTLNATNVTDLYATMDVKTTVTVTDTSLQQAYTISTGSTTPEIKLDSTRGSLDIQDANTSIAGNLLTVRDSNAGGLGNVLFSVNSTGQALFKNNANSTTAFQIQNLAGNDILAVDTQNSKVILNTADATAGAAVVEFAQSGTVQGNITINGATTSYNAFTGSHYVQFSGNIPEFGKLVSVGTDSNERLNGNGEYIYNAIESQVANDPRAFGSFNGSASLTGYPGVYLVSAAGNGEVWVVQNESGNISVGDPLISSSTAGYAMKDPKTYAVSHVFAKAAQGIDWNIVTTTIDGKKVAKISILYSFYDQNNISGTFQAQNLNIAADGIFGGSVDIAGSLNVTGPVTLNGGLMVNGNVTFNGNLTVQNITVANITVNGKIITAGNTPTATVGTAAGIADPLNNIAAPTVTITGNDTSGTITIVAGVNTTAGNLAEIIFDVPFSGTPRAILSAKNADSAGLQLFNSTELDKLLLNVTNTPVENGIYQFDYFIVQ